LEIEALCLSSIKHIFLLPWQVTLNLNERILKLWESIRPSGMKVDETNFFTPSEGLLGGKINN